MFAGYRWHAMHGSFGSVDFFDWPVLARFLDNYPFDTSPPPPPEGREAGTQHDKTGKSGFTGELTCSLYSDNTREIFATNRHSDLPKNLSH